jgi:xanthine dehydrogenase YagR molybdenum-binding subunit
MRRPCSRTATSRKATPKKPAILEAGFKAAATVVEASYATQVQTHVSLETHGCVCEWEGDKLTSWASTQAVHGTREQFAKALDIPQANVRVITEYMGGASAASSARRAGHHLREAGKEGGRGRQAAARPQGRAPGVGNRPSSASRSRPA